MIHLCRALVALALLINVTVGSAWAEPIFPAAMPEDVGLSSSLGFEVRTSVGDWTMVQPAIIN